MKDNRFVIKKYNRADMNVISEVKSFAQECTRIEGVKTEILPESSMNYKDGMPCLFTCELDNKLIGVLNVFAPGPFEAEIGALVHPEYRRHGIFKMMLREALRELKKYRYRRGLFVIDVSFKPGEQIAHNWGLSFDHGEYNMSNAVEELNINENPGDIVITEACEADLDELTNLGIKAFTIDYDAEKQLLIRTMNSPNRIQWAARKGDRIIGLCGIRIKNGECMVFGLGVDPGERRKGYAREILSFVAEYAEKRGADTFCLDVDSENAAALSLYEDFGLKRLLETKYYNFTFRKLKKHLK